MKPVGITMGCPVGIGPEIILRYFHGHRKASPVPAIVIGDSEILTQQAKHFNLNIPISPWTLGSTIPQGCIPVFNVSQLHFDKLQWAKPTHFTGVAMAKYIETGVKLCTEGFISGIATCPISKYALHSAGYNYPGHTEMLADLSGDKRFTMMMSGERLRVVLVTIHCGFKQIIETLTSESVYERICLTAESLVQDFGIKNPKIAVAALNPHAGEGGVFGDEEDRLIVPAITQAKWEDIDVQGPFPPDTVFLNAAKGNYDAVVCMYHDQGLIPFKLLHFDNGVNVTIGLSLVRTSVDHGTAYDIAGKGIAQPESLAAAVELASAIARNREKMI